MHRVLLLFLALVLAVSARADGGYGGNSRVTVGNCGGDGGGEGSNYSTIQRGVNAVSDGGTVSICPGTYNEAVTISGKALVLQSSTGNAGDVTISPSSGAGITTNRAMTVNNLSISSSSSGVNGINICPSNPATLAMSGVVISVANGTGLFQNTAGSGCAGVLLNLSGTTIGSPTNGSGIVLNNGTGDHVLADVSVTGADNGWAINTGIHISGGSSFTATDLDVTYKGQYTGSPGSNAALWLDSISGNATIATTDGAAHAIRSTGGGDHGLYFCPSAAATLTVAGASTSALTTVSAAGGAAIQQNTSGTCAGKLTLNLSNLAVTSTGASGINIQNGGGSHILNYLSISGNSNANYIFHLYGGSGANLTDVDVTGTTSGYAYSWLAYLEQFTGPVTIQAANKSQVSFANASGSTRGIHLDAAAGNTIVFTLNKVYVDANNYPVIETGNGGAYGYHTANFSNISVSTRAPRGVSIYNGAGNHVINNATLYGVNGSGWPVLIIGGANITLTDVDATQLGTYPANYPAVSLSGFTGNLTVNSVQKTGRRCRSVAGVANAFSGACITNLDSAGATTSTNYASYGLYICPASGSTSQLNLSGIYASGAMGGIVTSSSGCGNVTANIQNSAAETGSAYTSRGSNASAIGIANGAGTHAFSNVTAGDAGSTSGIAIAGGGATLTDVYAKATGTAINLNLSGNAAISNPVWAAANPYPVAAAPTTFPIQGLGTGGSGIANCSSVQDLTLSIQNTAVNSAGTSTAYSYGIAPSTNYCYTRANLVMANVTVNSASLGIYSNYGNSSYSTHLLSNVAVTAAGTAISLTGGKNSILSNITATCGSNGTTAATGINLDYQANTTLTGSNKVSCLSPGSTGISVGGGNGGCPTCTITGTTVDMNSQSNSVGIWARYGSSNALISGNYIKNAGREGVLVWEYPVTVSNNIVENSAQASGYSGINMTRGAGAAYNNCLYNGTSGYKTNGATSGATFCAGSYSGCKDGNGAAYPVVTPLPSTGAGNEGNFWGSWPRGSGFSDGCTDGNGDGLCDNKYNFNSSGFDYYPLAKCPLSGAMGATLPAPLLEYRMDEAGWSGTAGQVKDSTGTDNGTSSGAATTTASGELCRAGNFTTSSSYVSLGQPSLALTNQMTLSIWVNWQISPASGNSWANLFTYNSASGSDNGSFWLQHSGSNSAFEFALLTTSGRKYVQSSVAPQQGQWQHVVAVYDGSKMYLYVNGALSGSLSQTGSIVAPPADAVLTLGRWAYANSPRQFNGWLDEAKLFNTALSPAQVATLYANERAGLNWDASARSCGTLTALADYRLDEPGWTGASGEVADSSSSGLNGTANNAQTTNQGAVCGGGSFNGANADIQVANGTALSNAFNALSGVTFSAWANASAYATAKIVQRGDWDGHGLGMDSWNGWQATFRINGNSTTLSYGARPTLGQWYHIAGSYDGNTASLYVNGALVSSASVSGSLSTNSQPLAIGSAVGQKYFNGLIDEVHVFPQALGAAQIAAIYANELADKNWDGSARTCIQAVNGPSALNAVNPGANAVSGKISTKIAGTGFNLDVYALNAARSAQDTSINGSVLVDLLANAAGGTGTDAANCPTSSTALSVGTVTLASGKGSISVPAVANSWRDVRVRMRYPATGTATLTACSSDNFAVKPASLAVQASDTDWASVGTSRLLAASGAGSTPTHKAGRPFTLTATGYNAASVITSNYTGAPGAATVTALDAGANAGTLTVGSFSGSGGTVVSSTASYNDVGSLSVLFQDTGYASVDSGDSTPDCNGYYVCSGAITLGRFVPDHFSLSGGSATPACGSFNHFGQDGVATAFKLIAQEAGGNTTFNYTGSLARLDLTSYAALNFSASGLPSGVSLGSGATAPSGSWAAGVTTTVSASQLVSRPAAAIVPASIAFFAQPTDQDGVSAPSAVALGNAITFRYGRVRLQNAYGSQLLDLAMSMRSEYWNGSGWILNTDDGCTATTLSLAAAGSTNIAGQTCVRDGLSASGAGCSGTPPATRQFKETGVAGFAGDFNLWLKAPGVPGSVDVTAAVPSWLQYNWTGSTGNPKARATFGVFKSGPAIYLRENF